jgi:hypothetical protein
METHTAPPILPALGLTTVLALAGCAGPYRVAGRTVTSTRLVILSAEQRRRMEAEADGEGRRRAGKTWLLDGVCGEVHSVSRHCRFGLMAAGLPEAMEVWPWQTGWRTGWIGDVTDLQRNLRQAQRLCADVNEYRSRYPQRPVRLIGHSAGAALVVFALEQLPADSVEDVVLLSAGLSPGYDLTRALAAVRRRAIVVHSPLDGVVLGLGTLLFGTLDRRHSVSAGLTGFQWDRKRQTPWQQRQYAKLVQIRWAPWMVTLGYLGEHATSTSTSFTARVIAPLLTDAPAAGRLAAG